MNIHKFVRRLVKGWKLNEEDAKTVEQFGKIAEARIYNDEILKIIAELLMGGGVGKMERKDE